MPGLGSRLSGGSSVRARGLWLWLWLWLALAKARLPCPHESQSQIGSFACKRTVACMSLSRRSGPSLAKTRLPARVSVADPVLCLQKHGCVHEYPSQGRVLRLRAQGYPRGSILSSDYTCTAIFSCGCVVWTHLHGLIIKICAIAVYQGYSILIKG